MMRPPPRASVSKLTSPRTRSWNPTLPPPTRKRTTGSRPWARRARRSAGPRLGQAPPAPAAPEPDAGLTSGGAAGWTLVRPQAGAAPAVPRRLPGRQPGRPFPGQLLGGTEALVGLVLLEQAPGSREGGGG